MDKGFGLYVHWPFCQAKCPYCDFNSHVSNGIDHARWADGLLREIARVRDDSGDRVLNSIFFGGGTPSLMEPKTVAAIVGAAKASWRPANDIEITLEANPTSVESRRFAGFADAGVNRVSIGVQSLREADLKALGRLHTAKGALSALDVARANFDRVSFDLIYARQNQSLDMWRDELNEALNLGPDHLSLYQLTIEPGTAFGDRFERNRLPGLPDEGLSADMYNLTQALTEAAGLPAYEISNHAKPGAESRHNLIYWNSGDWAGIGPGAHGRLTIDGARFATESIRQPGEWLNAVEAAGSGETRRSALSAEETREEAVMMGLRVSAGVDARLITNNINDLIDLGLLEESSDRIRATAKGRPLLNAILREVLV